MNILEEIRFLSDFDTSLYYPLVLTLLNLPSILFEIFPFIFLISAQFFFLSLIEKDELIIFKNNGLSNVKILNTLILISLLMGVFFISVYYTFSSSLKHNYLNMKNQFSKDNKYLALVNENGLWIKEKIEDHTYIINGEVLEGNHLKNITITKLDSNFNLDEMKIVKKANISENNWMLKDVLIFKEGLLLEKFTDATHFSNFNINKISNTYSNLASQNIYELFNSLEDFKSLGISTREISSFIHEIFSYPIYFTIMTMAGVILMFNIRKTKISMVIAGVLASVVFYYIYYFSKILGINERVPIYLSTWLPHLLLLLICLIGVVKLNEK
tara:strand:+ start:9 stop:992 length:984 start_codon:yes stop_codon:yes gene_type:complete